MSKDRIDDLLMKAAESLENGADPFNHEFLVKNEVTADECFTLSEKMALIIKGFLGSDMDDQVLILGTGAVMGESGIDVKAFRNSLKLSQAAKRLQKINDIGLKQPRINDTSKTLPKVDPEEVRKALGAEEITDREGRLGHKP